MSEPLTTDKVRDTYQWGARACGCCAGYRDEDGEAFDAWLAAHDAEVRASALAEQGEPGAWEPDPLGHNFLQVEGHPDYDECTDSEDGTYATYCGLPEASHHLAEECASCDTPLDECPMPEAGCCDDCTHAANFAPDRTICATPVGGDPSFGQKITLVKAGALIAAAIDSLIEEPDRTICTCVDHLPPDGMPLPECPRHNPTDRTNRSEETR